MTFASGSEPLFKCGMVSNFGGDDMTDVSVDFGDVYKYEQTIGPLRLVIGASSGWVELILQLAELLKEPLGMLYILAIPRAGGDPGRYEAVHLKYSDVKHFVAEFKEFLECDARHALWIASMSGSFLVLDRHNLIHAYGNLDGIETMLTGQGFVPGKIGIPVPHSHHYHEEFDEHQLQVLAWTDWRRTDLRPGDDD